MTHAGRPVAGTMPPVTCLSRLFTTEGPLEGTTRNGPHARLCENPPWSLSSRVRTACPCTRAHQSPGCGPQPYPTPNPTPLHRDTYSQQETRSVTDTWSSHLTSALHPQAHCVHRRLSRPRRGCELDGPHSVVQSTRAQGRVLSGCGAYDRDSNPNEAGPKFGD